MGIATPGVYKRKLKNGDFYFGELLFGRLKNGKGTYYYANGDVYDGFYCHNRRSGEGIYTWSDGKQYAG